MDSFPTSFNASKVQVDIAANRLKKIEQDMKSLRKKIVDSFQNQTNYHSEVIHAIAPDLSEEEQKDYYKIIKEELETRGFTVRGKMNDNVLSLVVLSHTPRTHEMDKILKAFSDKEVKLSFVSSQNSDSMSTTSAVSSVSTVSSPLISPSATPSTSTSASQTQKYGLKKSPTKVSISAQLSPRNSSISSSQISVLQPPLPQLPANQSPSNQSPSNLPNPPPSPISSQQQQQQLQSQPTVNLTSTPSPIPSSTQEINPINLSNSSGKQNEDSEIDLDFIKRKLSAAKNNISKTNKK